VHDATQVVGNSGASPTMMELHDVLRKRYIKASKVGMAQALLIA
jgi:hypothetical protein